jgi:hypothetical protein
MIYIVFLVAEEVSMAICLKAFARAAVSCEQQGKRGEKAEKITILTDEDN